MGILSIQMEEIVREVKEGIVREMNFQRVGQEGIARRNEKRMKDKKMSDVSWLTVSMLLPT